MGGAVRGLSLDLCSVPVIFNGSCVFSVHQGPFSAFSWALWIFGRSETFYSNIFITVCTES